MIQVELAKLFSHPGRITSLSTVDDQGRPNAAVFGSARMLDAGRIAIGMSDNRSVANLVNQPYAVLLLCIPGPTMLRWKGARADLALEKIEGAGPLLSSLRQEITASSGSAAARLTKVAVVFRIEKVRPLLGLPETG